MRASAHCALWTIGALALAALPSFAQEVAQTDNAALVPEAPLTPEESAILGNALIFDPAALATPPKKPLRLPGASDKGFDVTRTEKPDGSTTVVVKQPLQTEWSNSVGADLGPSNSPGRSAFDRRCRRRAMAPFGSRLGIGRRAEYRQRGRAGRPFQ